MPFAIRLQSTGGKLIGYEVFDLDTNERVRAFTYALHTYDEHGVSKALTRALECAKALNGGHETQHSSTTTVADEGITVVTDQRDTTVVVDRTKRKANWPSRKANDGPDASTTKG